MADVRRWQNFFFFLRLFPFQALPQRITVFHFTLFSVSSTLTPTTCMSSFTASIYLLFGRPLGLLPGSSISSTPLAEHSSHIFPCYRSCDPRVWFFFFFLNSSRTRSVKVNHLLNLLGFFFTCLWQQVGWGAGALIHSCFNNKSHAKEDGPAQETMSKHQVWCKSKQAGAASFQTHPGSANPGSPAWDGLLMPRRRQDDVRLCNSESPWGGWNN